MTDARRRAEEALAKWDEHDSYFRERGRKYEGMSRACARSLAAALRAVLAEEDERGAEGLTPEVAATMNAHSLAELRPAPPAADEVREAAFARFGRALLPKWWDDGNPGDIDGGDAQEAAEACGLWHRVERHADGVECEWCNNEEPCGELTEAGLAALAKLKEVG